VSKDIRQLIRKARADGWTVRLTNGGHWRWEHPGGEFFFSAQTPGDWRVVTKVRQRMRQVEEGRRVRR
jgi:hypothetical protein